jgi:hypothetical protein
MAKHTLSLRDEVASSIPSRARRKWEDDLDPAVVAELEEIRADWIAGRLGPGVTRTGLSKAIAKTLQGRGIQASANTVVRWLDR